MRLSDRRELRAAALAALLVGACSDSGRGVERVCDPGAQDACACPGGHQGAQVCADDGSRWEACDCTIPSATGGSSGRGASGGSSGDDGGASGNAGSAGSGNPVGSGGVAGGSGGFGGTGNVVTLGGFSGSTSVGGGAADPSVAGEGGEGAVPSGGVAGVPTSGAGGSGGTGAVIAGGEAGQADPCSGIAADEPNPVDPDCVAVAAGTWRVAVDIFVMLDRSISMSETVAGDDPVGNQVSRWDGVRAGFSDFVQNPQNSNVGLGIQFFSASGVGNESEDCDVANYSAPEVGIGRVSSVGADVVAAIEDEIPSGLTPTYPALRGALEYATQHAIEPSAVPTVVVLVTDGLPTECDPMDVASIARLAQDAWQTHGVATYVIGLAQGLWNLDQVAEAGATGGSFVIQEGDVASQVYDALMSIAAPSSLCAYEIPDSPIPAEPVDYDRIQFIFDPDEGGPEEVPRVDDLAQCDGLSHGGWAYDSTVNPTSIQVCPCTCARLSNTAGDILVAFGCQPRTDEAR